MSCSRSIRSGRSRLAAGFTLLEVMVSIVILAMVLQASASATMVMTRSSDYGNAEVEQQARARAALRHLAVELRTSSSDADELGTPYMSVAGAGGQESLNFRRVADFGTNGAEVVPRWSTPIALTLEGNQLIRTQDSVSRVVANGVESLDFDIDVLGRVDVQIGMARASKSGGLVSRSTQQVRVSPQR